MLITQLNALSNAAIFKYNWQITKVFRQNFSWNMSKKDYFGCKSQKSPNARGSAHRPLCLQELRASLLDSVEVTWTQMLGNFEAKRNLFYACLPPFKKRSAPLRSWLCQLVELESISSVKSEDFWETPIFGKS